MTNSEEWIWEQYQEACLQAGRQLRALDFGCGNGRLITRALAAGKTEWRGADTYYGEEDITEDYTPEEIPSATKERIALLDPDGRLPFEDGSFEFICSNQVFEHVERLQFVVDELARISTPDAVHFHVFPTRERIVEAHALIPLVHRLPDPVRAVWAKPFFTRSRRRWTQRMGLPPWTTPFDEWWPQMNEFLHTNTFLRPWREFDRTFRTRFSVEWLEGEKLVYQLKRHARARKLAPLADALPAPLLRATELRRVGAVVKLQPLDQAS